MASCFLFGPELDTGDQQLVNGWQKTRIDCSWIPNLLDRVQHTETPQQLAGNWGHIGAVLRSEDEFSVRMVGISGRRSKQRIYEPCDKVGESLDARKPVQVTASQGRFPILNCCPTACSQPISVALLRDSY